MTDTIPGPAPESRLEPEERAQLRAMLLSEESKTPMQKPLRTLAAWVDTALAYLRALRDSIVARWKNLGRDPEQGDK